MSGVAAAIGGSAVLGYVGSQNAANSQSNAMGQSLALQKQMFDYQKQIQAPYQEAGTKALGQMQDPRFQKSFGMSDFQTSPGYQFSLQQGNNALKAMNAANGNSVSGAGMAALGAYNTGTANQEYQQAFNNYNSQLNNQYGRLATLSAGGAGANTAMGQAAQGFANQSSGLLEGGANAQAAAQMSQANSIGTGLSGIAGYMNRPQMPSANNQMYGDVAGMSGAGSGFGSMSTAGEGQSMSSMGQYGV